MKQKLIVLLPLLVFAVFTTARAQEAPAAAPAASTEKTANHRIVYDMSVADTAQFSGLMRQLTNVKRGWPEASIAVVVHGKSLDMLVSATSRQAAAIRELQQKGVVFAACENTMRRQQVEKTQLLPGVITVPMGIGEIITKQAEGWGYIKF
jgi:uncharacterized protein